MRYLSAAKGCSTMQTAQSHHLRTSPLLHALQSPLVQVTLHETWRVGALRLQPTAPTGLGRRHIDHTLFVRLYLFAAEDLLGRTAEAVGLLVVGKLAAVEYAAALEKLKQEPSRKHASCAPLRTPLATSRTGSPCGAFKTPGGLGRPKPRIQVSVRKRQSGR